MCTYCGQEEAGYIPDGMLGPTCGTCCDELREFGEEFADRRRRTRFLYSLKAITGGFRASRHHPFHQLFLQETATLGYQLAPFLILTSEWYTLPSTRAAVAAPPSEVTAGSDDGDGDDMSLLWEDY